MGRWDYLYEARPRAAVEVLLDEAAKAICEDLQRWPPPLEGLEQGPGAAALLAILERPRPHRLVYRAAFQLTRLDLSREYEELEKWEQEGFRSDQLTPEERDAAVFLWRYVAERVFDLSETLQSQLSRPKLLALVDRVENRLTAPSLAH